MIDINIEYLNYQQVRTVSKKEEEDRDLLPSLPSESHN